MSEFVKRLKQLRNNNKITQAQLAKELNVTQTAITYWENGKREPSQEIVEKLANYFNVTPAYLMGWEEENKGIYYLNDDAREMAQFMFENPEYKVLFDASRKVKKEDIVFVKEMIDRIRGNYDDTGC